MDKPINDRFNDEYERMKDAEGTVLHNDKDVYDFVVKLDICGDYNIFRTICKRYKVEYFIDSAQNIDEANEIYEKACMGLVKCDHCGKWITLEESRHYCPASCSCLDPECIRLAEREEANYLEMM